MKDIIRKVSTDIAKEIITRPNFDIEEISGIINFRLNESMLEILLANVELAESNYLKLLFEQSNNKVGSKNYVELGYKLAIAKHKKSVANRAVNNVRNKTKIGIVINYIKENHKEIDISILYDLMDGSEVSNG